MARPRIEIDKEQFEKLCSLMCTLDEMASFFKCSSDTIERWSERTYKKGFAEVYKTYSAIGKMSLRRTQFRLAEKSTAMAIFLGKQYLGQTDKIEQAFSVIDEASKIQVEAMINEIVESKRGD